MVMAEAPWTTPSQELFLSAGQVHLWLVSTNRSEVSAKRLQSVLSSSELESCFRLTRSSYRCRCIAVRAALRAILGSYLRVPPSALAIAASPSGKPYLDNQVHDRHPLHFSISYSADFAVIAVGRGLQVGIDVERIRSMRSSAEILSNFFSKAEEAWVRSHQDDEKAEAFIRVWTRREAASKAVGSGLMASFLNFSVPAMPHSPGGFSLVLPESTGETVGLKR
ncbi:MAG TPA: 4'-phosphopantetheinyl transferase superfamily protein, partial [Spirochaetia bacterium]|nr:4'-phosphopantetheinyl transferase superfamily protein [Spirochaetia bacterium]